MLFGGSSCGAEGSLINAFLKILGEETSCEPSDSAVSRWSSRGIQVTNKQQENEQLEV